MKARWRSFVVSSGESADLALNDGLGQGRRDDSPSVSGLSAPLREWLDAHRRALARAAWGIGLCAILLLQWRVSLHYPKTTDQANFFRAGMDLASGNWRLSGWLLTPPNFWTSDVALSAVLSRLSRALGFSAGGPFLLALQPAITWSLLVFACIAIAWSYGRDRAWRWSGVAILLAVLGFPLMRETVMYFITLSAIHVGTVLYTVLGFYFATRIGPEGADRGRHSRWHAVGLCLTQFLGVLGDPMMLFTGTTPVIAAALLAPGVGVRRRTTWLVGAGVSAGLAEAALWLNMATGGFQVTDLPMRFADYNHVGANIAIAVHAAIQWFSADMFGRTLVESLPELLHAPLLAAAVGLLATILLAMVRRRDPLAAGMAADAEPSLAAFRSLLAFGAICDVAALIASNRISLESNPIAAARYLLPLWVELALLLALSGRTARRLAPLAIAAIVASAAVNWPIYASAGSGILYPWQTALLRSLQERGLTYGLASYWDSGILGFATGGAVECDYVSADAAGRLVPTPQIHKWFALPDLAARDFFVVVNNPPQAFTEAQVRAQFGEPTESYTVEIYKVLVYRR